MNGPLVRIELPLRYESPKTAAERVRLEVDDYFIDAACTLRDRGGRWIISSSRMSGYRGPYANCVALEFWPYWEPLCSAVTA